MNDKEIKHFKELNKVILKSVTEYKKKLEKNQKKTLDIYKEINICNDIIQCSEENIEEVEQKQNMEVKFNYFQAEEGIPFS